MPIELDATDTAPRDLTPLDRTATVAGSARSRTADAGSAIGPGMRLAHFRIDRKLGEGGMGQVWLATDLALDRPVAIKLLLADVGGDSDRRQRLIREARAQARLVHPHVCHIYFIGEEDGRVFFAMEYVDGETLAQRLARGPLPPDQAVELARQAALGLRAADEAGFTHRDIKPSNLMVDRHGVLKVMDFGLVSASSAGGTAGSADGSPVAASALVGTPLYMAPEQGRGEAVDRRADIYALGATLHHMIAGAPPFAGDTAAELLSRHESGDRPRLTLTASTRRKATLADDVVAHMMAKRAADRYSDYDELVAALDRASTARTRPAGLSVRATAGVIDLLVASMVAMPLTQLVGPDDGNIYLAPIAFLLFPAAIARWGATPGRALLDLEIISHRGRAKVGFLQAALRYLACFGPLAVAGAVTSIGEYLENDVIDIGGGALGIAGAVYIALEMVRVAARSVDKRTMWDRIAGTRVCYRRSAAEHP